MDNMEYIDDYFNRISSAKEKQQFEEKILHDISFADQVAFYISANGVISNQLVQQKKAHFKDIYQQQKVVSISRQPIKRIWQYIAAACMVAAILLFGWLFTNNNPSPQQLADTYIQQNLQTLGVTMGVKNDSLQTGLNLYNNGKLVEAQQMFESIAKNDITNTPAIKYAGITSLCLAKYDKALYYFKILEEKTNLYSNPAKFYEALTFIKRNNNGDAAKAKRILEQVFNNNLEGKENAAKWLKELN